MNEPKILIVDDDYSFAEFAQMILKSCGYRTVICLEARKALDVALAERPDVILADLGMPDMDGVEVLRRLKSNSSTESIPVLICSVTCDETEIEQALRSGGAEFVSKPLKRDDIHRRIQSALGRHKGE